MSKCKFCAQEMSDNSNFCGYCGQRRHLPGESAITNLTPRHGLNVLSQDKAVISNGAIDPSSQQANAMPAEFASSQEKAAQTPPDQEIQHLSTWHNKDPETHQIVVENERKDVNAARFSMPQIHAPGWLAHPITPQLQNPTWTPTPKRVAKKRFALIAAMVALLVLAGTILFPILFAKPATPAVTSVGQISFTNSGQLDPTSSMGLNDTIKVSLHNLSTPASGKSYYAWLMPDQPDDNTVPLLLGKLAITGGKSQLTYTHPNHTNMLATYSRFAVAIQDSHPEPTTPPLDTKMLPYVGSIPNTPTPGDEKHFSLLDHMRHLLAKDPTLQKIGLQGGLAIWLDRNAEKILEWSSAARDNWAGGQQTDLIHRHMIRVLDYLDGVAYVDTTGDLPAGSPLLVDPQAGRIGLLEVSPTQALPAYLTHVDRHLQGLTNAPGHTPDQRQLTIKIDNALKADTPLFQNIRQDAIKLVKFNDTQLQSGEALSLLNDMVTNANTAYTGKLDPTSGGNINGIAWIHNMLQGVATIPVTTTKP
jgi:hypothetical protein